MCFALVKRGSSVNPKGIQEIREKLYGNVAQMFCVPGEKESDSVIQKIWTPI